MILSGWPGGIAHAAQVRGTIRLEGSAPVSETLTLSPKKGIHSTEGCGSLQKVSQKLLVDPAGGIQNVVIWLDSPQGGSADRSGGVVFLDQKECVFSPHVVLVAPGTEVAIRNSDPVLHNVRIFREGEPDMLMHKWQKPDASNIVRRFDEPGRFIVRCGVHPWMYGWVVVTSHAGTVTGSDGQFTLSDVSPGAYTLHLWHETLGVREVPILVKKEEEVLKPILFARSGNSS